MTKIVLPVLPSIVTKYTVVYRASKTHISKLTFPEKGVRHGYFFMIMQGLDRMAEQMFYETALLTLGVAQSELQCAIEFGAGGLSRPPQS